MKIRLFDGPITVAQQAIIALWGAGLFIVTALWVFSALDTATGAIGLYASVSLLAGLLATYFALVQFMLMSRIGWIEKQFGLDRLASFHRINGYGAILLMLVHVPLITLSYAISANIGFFEQYFELVLDYPYVLFAAIALFLFLIIIASSIYISRKRLKFETWYYVHLMAYLAIIFASFHQFAIGRSFQTDPVYYWVWLGLYIFVAANVIAWRFILPVINSLSQDFRVARVSPETSTTTNVYISAKNVQKLKVLPGQYILVRFFQKEFMLEEHPFTISMVPADNMLRLTIRASGDYTKLIPKLTAGTRVLISGPFGRFTHKVEQKNRRLLIAGGVGITPIHSLFQESIEKDIDTVVLYGNRNNTDVPLQAEIELLANTDSSRIHMVYSDVEVAGAESGRIDGDLITKLVSDFKDRDIFLCGPPPMMTAIISDLKKMDIDESLLHYEQFALHP